jgi:hypothetical protein
VFHREHLNPYVNFHRPCAVPVVITAANGKRRRKLSLDQHGVKMQ